ncbi:MAG: endonuclease/exonuclease/phosphatase family protein [Aliivibrio sp.]|uniref:endonuclease/exonuclease/phosphatase family protein n=1 Tax=Aliivibrio sp. TaxID=1872443 RepID=UPI001A5E166F|nr:endonuclease/exonuclease/phosphatase family protein [Aliivibrio sp.]
MRYKNSLLLFALIVISASAVFQWVFTVPKQAQLINIEPSSAYGGRCYQSTNKLEMAIDVDDEVSLLVWNIYKQQGDNWAAELSRLSKKAQLILLQETSLTSELKQFISESRFIAKSVRAFDAFETSTGVLNLSTSPPQSICAYIDVEPWLTLPKSALLAYYRLSNNRVLAVVNIHAINFTFGTKEYQKQLMQLSQILVKHQGPMIVAGDFNSWSESRLQQLKSKMSLLGLIDVQFTPDYRRRFVLNNMALDHVFYRGLTLKKAEAPLSDASDHNPMSVVFGINQD